MEPLCLLQRNPSFVVWSTGGVGAVAIDAIRYRPDMKLVGVWVHSPEKVGKDAGELAGGEPMGVVATNDADALIDLKPDCVVYAASGPQRDAAAVPDYLRLLAAGINVVSTSSTSLVYPPSYFSPDWREQLEAAAENRPRIVLRVRHLPRLCLRPTCVADDHAVENDPQHHGHRGCAERPLPGCRRDDGRNGFRSSTRLQTPCSRHRVSSNWPGRRRFT